MVTLTGLWTRLSGGHLPPTMREARSAKQPYVYPPKVESGVLVLAGMDFCDYEHQYGPVFPMGLTAVHQVYNDPIFGIHPEWVRTCVSTMEHFKCLGTVEDPETDDGHTWELAHFFNVTTGTVAILFPRKEDGKCARHCAVYYIANEPIRHNSFNETEVERLLEDFGTSLED